MPQPPSEGIGPIRGSFDGRKREAKRGDVVDLSTCYQKTPSVVGRRIEDEVILVPIGRNVGDLQNIYTLNEVAAHVWESIDGRRSLGEIVGLVLREFEVDRQQAEADVLELARQLEGIGGILSTAGQGALSTAG